MSSTRKSRSFSLVLTAVSVLGVLGLVGVAAAREGDRPSREDLLGAHWSEEAPWSSNDVEEVLSSIRREALRDAPAPQAAVFEDGLPTNAEYKAAIRRTLECAEAAGLTVIDVEESHGGLYLGYGVVDDRPDSGQVFDDCYRQHAFWIDRAYQVSTERQKFEYERATVECLRSSGVDVASVPHPVTGEPTDGSTLPLGYVLMFMADSGSSAGVECLR